MKLRIRRNPFGNKLGWLCSDGLYAYWGETPEEAYKAYVRFYSPSMVPSKALLGYPF